MLSRQFNPNTVLNSMSYNNNVLSVEFKKGQVRQYCKVPPPIAYGFFYTKTAADTLKYYSTQIKGKFEVLTVKNL